MSTTVHCQCHDDSSLGEAKGDEYCEGAGSNSHSKQPINTYEQPINTYKLHINTYKQHINTYKQRITQVLGARWCMLTVIASGRTPPGDTGEALIGYSHMLIGCFAPEFGSNHTHRGGLQVRKRRR